MTWPPPPVCRSAGIKVSVSDGSCDRVGLKSERRWRLSAVVIATLAFFVNAQDIPATTEDAKTTGELFDKMEPKRPLVENGKEYKLYEHRGQKFKVFRPENGRMAVEALGVSGAVYFQDESGEFRGEARGWGASANTPKGALDLACSQIASRAGKPSAEDGRKAVSDLYDSL